MDLGQLELVAPWSGPSQLLGRVLKLNSHDLYSDNRPKKYGEILSLVLALLLRDGLKLSVTQANWPFQVFSLFQENMRSLNLPNYNFVLHALTLKMPRTNEAMIQALALEKEKVTEDLTAELLKATNCANATWEIESWNYSALQSWVRAQIGWQCGRQLWYGELQILLNQNGVSRLGIVRRTQIR